MLKKNYIKNLELSFGFCILVQMETAQKDIANDLCRMGCGNCDGLGYGIHDCSLGPVAVSSCLVCRTKGYVETAPESLLLALQRFSQESEGMVKLI